jgi:hypothetical protein
VLILEQRALSNGHHTIDKLLNGGIDLGAGPIVPPTPSLLAYQRKAYLERQDPERGDVFTCRAGRRQPPGKRRPSSISATRRLRACTPAF